MDKKIVLPSCNRILLSYKKKLQVYISEMKNFKKTLCWNERKHKTVVLVSWEVDTKMWLDVQEIG